jgi:crossover junction endodeoxyribonuclease RusA
VIELEVFGRPVPQGSKKVINGRIIEAQSGSLKKWRKAIELACKSYNKEIYLGPVRLEVDFYLERPKTVSFASRPFPIKPPDLDKLVRGVGDDSQIIELAARKFYADDRETGAIIRIFPL